MAKVLSLVFDTPDLDVLVKSGDKHGSMKRLAHYLDQLASGNNAGTNTLTAIESGVRATGTLTFAATQATATVTFAATQSTGTVTFASAANENDTVTVNGTAFTAKAAPSGDTEFAATVSAPADAQALKAKINAHPTIGAIIQASGGAAALTLTSVNVGSSTHLVNSYTLAESTATARISVSGAKMTGGTNVGYVNETQGETDTVTVNGAVLTGKNSTNTTTNFAIGTGAPATANATTATNFAAAVNRSADAGITGLITATAALGVVTLTSVNVGSSTHLVNSYTLTESASATTVSGAKFTGGTNVGYVNETQAETDTLVINGVTFTGVNSGATGDQFNIGTGAPATANAATAASLVTAINASTSDGVENTVTATSSAGVVTLTADDPGVGGNAIDLAESCTATTKSGTALSGGTDGTRITFTF